MSDYLVRLFDMLIDFVSADFWDLPVYFALAYCCFAYVLYFIEGGRH